MRSVYLDAAAERNGIKNAYAKINHGGPAYGMLNDYMRQETHNPFKRAVYESVGVEVQSVLPLTSDTWRVEWVETTRDRDGHETNKATWTATITITVQPPTDDKAILANPTGLYVQDLHWSKRL
jgi:type IV secretion system protein VirB5